MPHEPKIKHWGNPPRRSVRDLPPEDADEAACCPGDLEGKSGDVRSSLHSLHSLHSPKIGSGKFTVWEEILNGQSRISQQVSREADELKILMEGLNESFHLLQEELARMHIEKSSSAAFIEKLSEKFNTRSQKARVSFADSNTKVDSDKGEDRAIFPAINTRTKSELGQTWSDGATMILDSSDTSLASCFRKIDAEFAEKVNMNGVSEISLMRRCGQDEPLIWCDIEAPMGQVQSVKRASFAGDTFFGDGEELATSSMEEPSSVNSTSPLVSGNGSSSVAQMSQSNMASNFSRNRNHLTQIPSTASAVLQDSVTHGTSTMFADQKLAHRRAHVLNPDSLKRNAWDMCSFLVLIFDFITIPYQIAWNPAVNSVFVVFATWGTMIFWTFDMMINFNTAFYVGSDLETRRIPIIKKYLRTSFLFDCIATGSDWTIAVFDHVLPQLDQSYNHGQDDQSNFASLLRFVKAQRVFRVARFLRVSSVWSRLEQMHSLFLSDSWTMMTQVVTMLLGLFLVNHVICCFWFAIGKRAHKDTGRNWLDTLDEGYTTVYGAYNDMYLYVTSYHFVVTNMFVGSMQVNAMNSSERLFNIFCNLFGTFFTAAITSWFSALLVRNQSQQNEFESIMKSIRQYLRLNKVEPAISARVQRQLAMRLSARKRESENDIEAFKMLSKNLRAEVRIDVTRDVLFSSPMIMLLDSFDHAITLNLALQFEYVELVAGEDLFEAKRPMDKAYGVVRGCLVYTFKGDLEGGGSFSDAETEALAIALDGKLCEESDWISEAALWVQDWCTRGLMECHKESELLSLERTRLHQSCGRYGKLHALLAAYAKSYEDLLNNQRESEITDITPPVDHPVVIMNMDTKDRAVAAEPVLMQLRSQEGGVFSLKSRPKKGVEVIEREVKNGECGLILDKSGNPSRIAFVVLLRAERSDGLVLIQVAKYTEGHATAKLQMPATKMKDGERVTDAAQRILKKNLGQFGGAQPLGRHTQDVLEKSTEGYGMDTCFYRTQILVPFEMSDITPPVVYKCATNKYVNTMKTLSRSLSKASRFESHSLQEMMPDELYFVKTGPSAGTIYAWMSDLAFTRMGEIENEKVLVEYVSHLEIPEDLNELEK